jgi:hypothetical protein
MNVVNRIWKERNKILEGVKNSVFKKADVENIAAERMKICATCDHIDTTGDKCVVPGTQPCCGLCGCSLHLKTRALSASCDDNRWLALVHPEDEEIIFQHLEIDNNNSDEKDNV